jgi:flagellar hook-associated protein 1 FlgK
MSSLGSILSIARSAIQAHQIAIQTTSQNIANAEVEGYSAQRVAIAASTPQNFTYGSLGTGVVVLGITRARDVLLDDQFRKASTSSSAYGTSRDMLARIEAVLGEPSATGLSNAMDVFWNSWSDLSADPASLSARGVVQQRGSELAGTFNRFASQLDEVSGAARGRLTADIGKINELARQIAEINPAIVAAETTNASANDLRDTRDRLIDQISKLGETRAIERNDGSVGVYLAGRLLVDGPDAKQLTVAGSTTLSVRVRGESDDLLAVGGSVGAALDSINTEIPSVLANLDALAGTIVREVNAIHSGGKVFNIANPGGVSAGNFFEQSGSTAAMAVSRTARGIRLSSTLSSLTEIASSASSASGPGNNAVAAGIAGLRNQTLDFYDAGGTTIATASLGTFYRDTVAAVGLAAGQASNAAAVHGTLASQADTRRQSVSGVATDEELVGLIKHQQAYAAAARLVKVVDEMAQTLVDLGR